MTAHDFAGFAHCFTRVVAVADGRIRRDGPIRDVLADVPLLRELGLEIPVYVQWAYERLGARMTQAPLDCNEALALVRAAGGRCAPPDGHGEPAPDASAQAIDAADPSAAPSASETPSAPAVAVEQLTVRFGRKSVLRDVSFTIGKGEIVALVGYNGSGKSTLALTLAGAIVPASGAIAIDGRRHRARRGGPATGIGYVFQYPEHQFLYDTALAEMMHGLEPEREDEARRTLASIGIAEPCAHPYELSGGEKRRLGVQSAMALAPPVLILDEPTYGQDGRNRERIEADIRRLNAAGTTIIVITHDMDFIRHVARRALVLRHGELVFDGATHRLLGGDVCLSELGLISPMSATLAAVLAASPHEATR
jgi:energy-coupling factor transport system ATP-binding protein